MKQYKDTENFTGLSEAATGGVLQERCSYFAKFTGKQLCQSLFFNKVARLRPQASGKSPQNS